MCCELFEEEDFLNGKENLDELLLLELLFTEDLEELLEEERTELFEERPYAGRENFDEELLRTELLLENGQGIFGKSMFGSVIASAPYSTGAADIAVLPSRIPAITAREER